MKVTSFVASLLIAASSVHCLVTPTEDVLLGRQVSANDIRGAALKARNNWGPNPPPPPPAHMPPPPPAHMPPPPPGNNHPPHPPSPPKPPQPHQSKKPKKQKCGVCGYGPRYAVGYWAAILAPNKCAIKCQRDYKCTTYSLQRKRGDKWVCKLYKHYKNMTIINDVTNPDGRATTKWFVKSCPRPRIDPNNPEHLKW